MRHAAFSADSTGAEAALERLDHAERVSTAIEGADRAVENAQLTSGGGQRGRVGAGLVRRRPQRSQVGELRPEHGGATAQELRRAGWERRRRDPVGLSQRLLADAGRLVPEPARRR